MGRRVGVVSGSDLRREGSAEVSGYQLPQMVLGDLRERRGEESVDTREGERVRFYWGKDLTVLSS